MKKFFASTRNVVLVIVGALLVIAVAVVGALSAYYHSHALPGTTVAGQEVGGLSRSELTEKLQEIAAAQQVTVTDEYGDLTVPAAQSGVHIAVAPTVQAVFDQASSPWSTLVGLFSGDKRVPTTVAYNENNYRKFVSGLPLSDESQAKDAGVVFSDGAFQVTPAAAGEKVNDQALLGKLQNAVGTGDNVNLVAELEEVTPTIGEDAAQVAADQAQTWAETYILIDDGDALSTEPDLATRAAWIDFTPDGEALVPSVDEAAVKKWVTQFAKTTNIEPKPGYHNMENGKVVATSSEPTSGWVAANIDQVTQSIVAGLPQGEPIHQTFTYEEKDGGWEERDADPATAGLRYRAAPGEKWIDLDLTNSSVTAYEGAKVVGGPYAMVPGAPETPTVEGEYNVYLKYERQTMRGENVDGSKYETPDVPWVTYFTGSYAFHGAPWRYSFGWNGPGGSHGCVNMPVDAAKFIYDWADMGTKVVSHS